MGAAPSARLFVLQLGDREDWKHCSLPMPTTPEVLHLRSEWGLKQRGSQGEGE